MILQARGHFTKAQVSTALDLKASDDAQWDAVQAWLTTGNPNQQLVKITVLDAVVTAHEQGYINPAQVKTILQNEGAVL